MRVFLSGALGAVFLVGLVPLGLCAQENTGFSKMEPTTKAECSACHNAYPAELLPAASWNKILDTLDHHFGEDASLAPDQVKVIRAYLTTHADPNSSAIDPEAPPLRITGLPWYQSEHGKRLVAQAKADPSIGTMSNCTGCHQGFDKLTD